MEMHQVRYFLALAEQLHFGRAARLCSISQPAMTNAISLLEQHIGGPLFHRRPQVALTALGHAVWPYLNQIAQNARGACETARALIDVSEIRSAAASPLHEPKNPMR